MSNGPATKFRLGLVTATVWKNTSGEKSFYSVKVSRSYKDGDEWKEADQFNHDDLFNLMKVLERAEAWIERQKYK